MASQGFVKRTEAVDWTLIDAINIDLISRGLGFDLLQEALKTVTFSDIESEYESRKQDHSILRLVKVVQLSQFLLEYLLHSQDFLKSKLEEVTSNLDQRENLWTMLPYLGKHPVFQTKSLPLLIFSENDLVKQEYKKSKHLWRKELSNLLQMTSETPAVFQCQSYGKNFLSVNLLSDHAKRRHPIEEENEVLNENANVSEAPIMNEWNEQMMFGLQSVFTRVDQLNTNVQHLTQTVQQRNTVG